MICKGCRKNLGKTTKEDRKFPTIENIYQKKCPACGFVTTKCYQDKEGPKIKK